MPTSTYNCNVEIIQNAHAVNVAGQSKKIVNRFVYVGMDASEGYVVNQILLAADFIAKVKAAWNAFLNVGYLDDYISIRQMDDATNPATTIIPGLGNGSNGILADMVAPDMTAYIKLKTNYRGKNFSGSKHISPISETSMAQGQLEAGAITQLKAIQTAIHQTISDGTQTFTPAIMSQNLSQTAVNPVWVRTATLNLTNSVVNKTLGTQRHRRYPTLIG